MFLFLSLVIEVLYKIGYMYVKKNLNIFWCDVR